MVWAVLVLAVLAVSVAKAPIIPVNDPALYEYYGRALLHGGHLYRDLPEVKLPSIYYINALWQWAFGENYTLHAIAWAAIDLGAIILFALVLRANGIASWRSGTLLFAIAYALFFPQGDYPQHYAVPLILLGILLSGSRPFAGGAAILLAATFWIPSLLTFGALLARDITWRARRRLLLGAAIPAIALYVALIPVLGAAWLAGPAATWPGFVTSFGFDFAQLRVTVEQSGLGPAIGALLALLCAVIERPRTEAQRFSLLWVACALAGTFIPPKWSEHYFLPAVPALTMALFAYGISLRSLARRPITAAPFALCVAVACSNAAVTTAELRGYSAFTKTVGGWIRSAAGPGAVLFTDEFIPELYLAAQAVPPEPGALGGQGNGFGSIAVHVPFGVVTGSLIRPPAVVVYGPHNFLDQRLRFFPMTLNDSTTRRAVTYYPACQGRLLGPLAVFVSAELVPHFRCGNDL